MVKATNPHTRQIEIVTEEQAEAMKRGAACRGYQFEALPDAEPIIPPLVEMPENLPTPPPAVEMPENAPKCLSEADIPALMDGTLEGTFETALGKMQFTKPAKRRK